MSTLPPSLRIFSALLLPLVMASTVSSAEWASLRRMLPASSNSVLAIDAVSFFGSELARKHRWGESLENSFDETPIMLPPGAERFAVAAELDIEHFEPTRQFAAMSMGQPIPLDEIRQRIGGNQDVIGGQPALLTPQGSFIVPISEDRVVLARLAQRQWVAHQVKLSRSRRNSQVHRLIHESIASVADGSSHISLCVVLEDAVPTEAIRDAVSRSQALRPLAAQQEQVVTEFAGLEGFIFNVRVTDHIHGELDMVFLNHPKELSKVAKSLILEVLSGAGATLPEFYRWEAQTANNRFGLHGPLTMSGLRRVLSLLNFDSADTAPLADVSRPARVRENATKSYVRRVTELVNDLTSSNRSLRDQVLWTDRIAKKIKRLSIRNVDPKAVQIGRQISTNLGGIVAVFDYAANNARNRSREIPIEPVDWRGDLRAIARFRTPYGEFHRYKPFAYAQINIRGVLDAQRKITKEELASANHEAKQILTDVLGQLGELRRIADPA